MNDENNRADDADDAESEPEKREVAALLFLGKGNWTKHDDVVVDYDDADGDAGTKTNGNAATSFQSVPRVGILRSYFRRLHNHRHLLRFRARRLRPANYDGSCAIHF